MNSSARFVPALFVFTGLIFMSSCYKIYDFVKQHPGEEVNTCRIKLLYQGTDTVTIHYNSAGDPIDMIKNRQDASWQSDKVFKYDKSHRLTDYEWATKGSNYRLIWHRYGYPKKSIVTDSLFTYISDGSGPNPPKENFSNLAIDSLDAEGRIVKLLQDPYSSFAYTASYAYNAKGNIDLPYAVYDNQLSILHTNTVWMFLNRDYSVNNRLNNEGGLLTVTNYNQAGLPLDFTIAPGNHGSDVLFVIVYQKLQVAYDCN
jgi:hypothetical protein